MLYPPRSYGQRQDQELFQWEVFCVPTNASTRRDTTILALHMLGTLDGVLHWDIFTQVIKACFASGRSRSVEFPVISVYHGLSSLRQGLPCGTLFWAGNWDLTDNQRYLLVNTTATILSCAHLFSGKEVQRRKYTPHESLTITATIAKKPQKIQSAPSKQLQISSVNFQDSRHALEDSKPAKETNKHTNKRWEAPRNRAHIAPDPYTVRDRAKWKVFKQFFTNPITTDVAAARQSMAGNHFPAQSSLKCHEKESHPINTWLSYHNRRGGRASVNGANVHFAT